MNDFKKILLTHGPILTKKAPWLNGVAALAAFLEVESSWGIINHPRYEPAYGPQGRYFPAIKDLWDKHGSWASCSYSSWQIMYPTAVELGFRGRPIDLSIDECAVYWVLEYIERRCLAKGADTIEKLADAYNSGSCLDRNVPHDYIAKFVKSYADVIERRGLNT